MDRNQRKDAYVVRQEEKGISRRCTSGTARHIAAVPHWLKRDISDDSDGMNRVLRIKWDDPGGKLRRQYAEERL